MIIGEPRVEEQGEAIRLAAAVEYERADLRHQEDLWFRVPRSYADWLRPDIDAFAIAMLPSAMATGEPLRLRAPISPRVAWGLREYQHVQAIWFPQQVRFVDVEYAGFEERQRSPRQTGVGSTFSGGLDSFYTLLRQRPDEETLPGSALTHCLMINGFDKDNYVNDTARFARLRENYRPTMERLGIELLSIETNAMPLRRHGIPGRHLRDSFNTTLAAAGFALGGLFARFYLPGGVSYRPEQLVAAGSHPVLDHLLSSESLIVEHHGADARRVDKAVALADWEECRQTLRVCFERETYDEQTGRLENCCRCEKCLRTMAALAAIDRLDAFPTFPRPLDRGTLRRVSLEKGDSRLFYQEVLELAESRGQRRLASDLRYAMRRGRLMASLPRSVRGLLRRLGRGLGRTSQAGI